MQAKVASVADKDTREDILLLAGLGAAIGVVALETVVQAENLTVVTPEQSEATRSRECSRNHILVDALPIKHSNKTAIQTKPDAVEAKLTL